MKNLAPEKKRLAVKMLAVVGFVGVIIAIAWLAVKIVNLAPAALSSLAAVAGGLYRDWWPHPALVVEASAERIGVGEELRLRWDKKDRDGAYVFSYVCREGLEAEMVVAGERRPILCNAVHNLGNVNELALLLSSEKEREAEFSYLVGFLPPNEREPRSEGGGSVTVLNEAVPSRDGARAGTEAPNVEPSPAPDEGVVDEIVATPPAVVPPTPPIIRYVYQMPVSNPHGYTDLSVRFLEIGTLVGERFFPAFAIPTGSQGAVRFEVRNIGTKTSAEWSYRAELPGLGEHRSPAQAPLKPNERAVITLGFPAPKSVSGLERAIVAINAAGDNNPHNDRFLWAILVTR
jgi:hypothetical protein